MSEDELDRFARERRDADARYNDALTALDRALVDAANHDTLSQDQIAQVGTALIVFLQRITAFVESKDREIAANLDARLAGIARALEPIAELRTQIGVLQRTTQMLQRATNASPDPQAPRPAHAPAPSPQPPASGSDITYVSFEDEFRGSDEAIQERLRAYVPIFEGASDVLDIGCGRGELLHALKAAGIAAKGVDANGEMAAIARERGLDAVQGDALSYVASRADASLGGIVATQVVEHLEPSYLIHLLAAASQKLRQNAPIVLETINPACWLAFFSSYIRDLTHVRPIHPETLQYLLRAHGFDRVEIRYSAPVSEHVRMQGVALAAEVLASPDPSALALTQIAHTINANAAILNSLMFTHLDYAAIGYRT
jgi:SAM-dependent methyltransferase